MLIKNNYTLLWWFILLLYFCKKIRGEYLLPCIKESDCEEIKGSTCEKNVCKCPIDEIVSGNMTVCLKITMGYGSPCEESQQCSNWLLMGSECIDGICTCSRGYHYRNGQCHKTKSIGESCGDNLECYDGYDIEALQCDQGTCKCSSNYNFRLNTDCRRIAKEIGDPCVIDSDCLFEDASCNKDFKCDKIKSSEEEDTQDINNLNQKSILIIEKSSTHSSRLAKDPVLGTKCNKDENCNTVKNSICFGTCRCNRKFMADLTKDLCIPELGTETDDKEYCNSLRNSEYRDGKCLCKIGFSYINNKECLKPTRYLNYSCTRDENCHTFGPAAICKSKRCECNENSWYDDSSMICRVMKGIGDTCIDDQDCYLESSVSVVSPICNDDKKCDCPENSYPAADNHICQPSEVGVGEHCYQSSDCVLKDSDCINNICACRDTYYFNEELNRCLPGVGADCKNDADCTIKDSVCSKNEKKCECEKNYTYVENRCLKVASSYNDTCTADQQCQVVFNKESSCQKGHCLCNENSHFRNGKCWEIRLLGQSCTRDGQCYVNTEDSSVECRNSQCQCSLEYVKNPNNLGCRKKSDYRRNSAMKNSFVTFLIILSTFNLLLTC